MEKAAMEIASQDNSGQIFVFVGLTILLSGFSGMLWWFVRDKISTMHENFRELKLQHKEDINRINDEHVKFKDWFNDRLHQGSETMTELKHDIKQIQGDCIHIKGDRVRPDELRSCKLEHEMLYKEQERSIERLADEVSEVKESLIGITKKVEGGFEMLSKTLSKKLIIDNINRSDVIENKEV